MIEKPPGSWQQDWQREDRTIRAARQFGGAASKALSAGASGLARARALYGAFLCGMMALMSGFAALSAGLAGSTLPSIIGAGAMCLGLLFLAQRCLRKAFGSTTPSRAEQRPTSRFHEPETGLPGFGSEIRYNRKRLVWRIAMLLPVCAVLAAAVTFPYHRKPPVTVAAWLALGFVLWTLVALLRRVLASDLTAIAWDDSHLRLRTLHASRQVPWNKVKSIQTRRVVTRLYGLIPLSTTQTLVFKLHRKPWARSIALPLSLLTIPPGALEDLARTQDGGFAPSFGPNHASPDPSRPDQPAPTAGYAAEAWAPQPAAHPWPAPDLAPPRPFGPPGPAQRPFGRKGTQPKSATLA